MDTSALKLILNKVAPIENEAWNEFEQYFSKRNLKKNETLWKTGEVCKHLVFIKCGLIRCFKDTEVKEISTQFFFENSIFYDDYSFVTQNPCVNSYEALEETELIVIPRAALNMMYDKYKSFERVGRKIIEHHHILLIEIQQNIKNHSSEEKYRNLIAKQPDIIMRVPLKFIASYLNMTPEYLSKIRRKILEE